MRSEHGHVHDLVAAYSMDALDEVERARFERHLAGCGTCSAELRDFTETAARLGSAAAVRPPVGLRERVMTAVRATRQLSARRAPGGRLVRLHRAAAGAVAAAALSAGVTAVVLSDDAARVQGPGAEVASVLTAADSRQTPLEAVDGGTGVWHSSDAEEAGVLVVSGLPAAPDGQAYQVWLSAGDEMTSAGLLPDDGILPIRGAAGDAAIALTLEHAGGATSPTGPLVMTSRGA